MSLRAKRNVFTLKVQKVRKITPVAFDLCPRFDRGAQVYPTGKCKSIILKKTWTTYRKLQSLYLLSSSVKQGYCLNHMPGNQW